MLEGRGRAAVCCGRPGTRIGEVAGECTQWTRGRESTGDLFDELRRLRHELAAQQDVPAFIVFSDTTLRDHGAPPHHRRSTAFRQVRGVGDKKRTDYGQAFVDRIAAYCRANELAMDVSPPATPAANTDASPDPVGPRLAVVGRFSAIPPRAQRAASGSAHRPGSGHGARYLIEYLTSEADLRSVAMGRCRYRTAHHAGCARGRHGAIEADPRTSWRLGRLRTDPDRRRVSAEYGGGGAEGMRGIGAEDLDRICA